MRYRVKKSRKMIGINEVKVESVSCPRALKEREQARFERMIKQNKVRKLREKKKGLKKPVFPEDFEWKR